ncbi:ABC transporter ATP-binding protein [Bradyrhizobium neotropicale]|uniref:ABC transporter ATP-binding protein n=1 Tax=Bradyrhizobium neotropicale TaxID=1497615 RepID=UPI001AD67822|nr:ABC transporter ATP-binding protein [Bradyrhizobium neotropicale]MBO4223592.1 ATP-binding cassette domain-containing protein [Bradyrhizobium neotropicale]
MLMSFPPSKSDATVKFDGVTVEFPVYSAHGRSFKRSILQFTTGGRIGLSSNQRVVISALNNVSLVAEHGERIGLIGHNGAGKSTILRAIAGVYEPVHGTISICGRVASLIDLTLGMDMEATGYENIRVRSLLLGLTPAEIDARIDEIGAVSELGDFLSMPIRTYSSGMLLRLAFAISTSIDPDVLLMDEWISAGDASFAKKAHHRLMELLGRTGILFIATHSDAVIRNYCTRVIWLDKGTVRADGRPEDIVREYSEWMNSGGAVQPSEGVS